MCPGSVAAACWGQWWTFVVARRERHRQGATAGALKACCLLLWSLLLGSLTVAAAVFLTLRLEYKGA